MDEDRGPGGRDGDEHAGDVWVEGVLLSPGVAREVAGVRAESALIAAAQARRLRWVAGLAARCAADARAALAGRPRVPGTPSETELVHTVVTHELMAVLGIEQGSAERLEVLASRLVHVLPDTLAALATARVDLARAEALCEGTVVLDDAGARAVQALLLPLAGAGPWRGPAPRVWRARVARAVITVDADAARRRREIALRARAVRAWARGDGTGVLQVLAADTDIALADRVITDLAHALPPVAPGDPHGAPLSLDQRRADALIDLLRRVGDGAGRPGGPDLPGVAVRRDREVAIVLHADTLFGDGPAHADPGELRGLGPPAPLDPGTAAGIARAQLGRGAGTRVLLVEGTGEHPGLLRRTLRLPPAPPGGWTRPTLTAAVRAAVTTGLPALHTAQYAPTVPIAEHVRAAHPRCTSYDCPRASRRCDLDHDVPWPRGPTDVGNLSPRCRRHHELKTRGLLHTRLHPDGTLTTTTLLGLTVTTGPEPPPGHGPGETYNR